MQLLAHTLDILGKVMVSYMAIAVHYRVRKEHKIDETVFKHMRHEQIVGIAGITFMIVGYLLQLPELISL